MSFLPRLSRLSGLRAILLSATLLGMLACLPLWLNSRDYPLLPVTPFFPVLAAPWDRWLLGSMLLSLIVAFTWYRPAILFFLGATLFLYLGDQNRGQPWLYMYWLMLGFTLLPEATALAACRMMFSAVYVFGGIHKCNANYFQVIPAWFVSPATGWGFPVGVVQFFRMAVAAAPVIEILVGLVLWVKGWRWFALAVVVAIPRAIRTQLQLGRVALEPGNGGAGFHPVRNVEHYWPINQHRRAAPIEDSSDRSEFSMVTPHLELLRLVGQLLLLFPLLDATGQGGYLRVGGIEESTPAKVVAFCT